MTVVRAIRLYSRLIATPAPPPAVRTLLDLLNGDHALAGRVIAELQSNPLTTFVSLMRQEEKLQQAGGAWSDTIVYDNQCKK